MPTRNISLTSEQDAFVDKVVKTGEYQNASEAIRDALRVLQQLRPLLHVGTDYAREFFRRVADGRVPHPERARIADEPGEARQLGREARDWRRDSAAAAQCSSTAGR